MIHIGDMWPPKGCVMRCDLFTEGRRPNGPMATFHQCGNELLVSTVCASAAGLVVTGFGWAVLAVAAMGILVLTFGALALDRYAAPVPG